MRIYKILFFVFILFSCTKENTKNSFLLKDYKILKNFEDYHHTFQKTQHKNIDTVLHYKFNSALQEFNPRINLLSGLDTIQTENLSKKGLVFFIKGSWWQKKNTVESYKSLLKAEDCFTKNKDTLGLLLTYIKLYEIHKPFVYEDFYGSEKLSDDYKNKVVSISKKYKHIFAKLVHNNFIIRGHSKKVDFSKINEIEKIYAESIALIHKHPEYEFYKYDFYKAMAYFYYINYNFEKEVQVNNKLFECKVNNIEHRALYNKKNEFTYKNNYDSLVYYLDKSYKSYIENKIDEKVFLQLIYDYRFKLALSVNNLQDAVFYNMKSDSINKIVETDLKNVMVFQLDLKHNTEKKDIKNKLLESNNKELKLIIVLVILSFLIVLFVVFYLRQKSKHDKVLFQFKEDVFRVLSHDLKSPFLVFEHSIKSTRKFVEENNFQEVQNQIKKQEKHVSKMKLLLSNLLDWLWMDKLTQETISIEELVNTITSDFYLLDSSITINIECNQALLKKVIPKKQPILIIVRNLLSNIVKHTDATEIKVNLYFEHDAIVIVIKDNDNNISTETLLQIETRITNKQKALEKKGIGLQLIRKFLKLSDSKLIIFKDNSFNVYKFSTKIK